MAYKQNQTAVDTYSSDGETTTDDGKRKKDFSLISPFGSSKKTPRSPRKKMLKVDNHENTEMQELKSMFRELLTEMREIKEDQRNFIEELKNTNRELKELRGENKELKDRLSMLERNMEKMDKAQRRNNVIIKGINFDNDIRKFENFCKERLQIQVRAESLQSRNTKKDEKLSVIKFKNWEEKQQLMKIKNKLKGSQIYIDHDMTKAESEVQKILRDRMKTENAKGHSAKVGYHKIYINGECWFWNPEKNQLEKKGN